MGIISPATNLNAKNTFTLGQAIAVPAKSEEKDLTLSSDTQGETLELANITAGENPARTPGIIFTKDATKRWNLSVDATAGAQGDFDLFSFKASKDIIYIGDTATPGMAIGNADRAGAASAQLRVVNLSATRATLIVAPAANASKPTVLLFREETGGANVLEVRDSSLETLLLTINNAGEIKGKTVAGNIATTYPARVERAINTEFEASATEPVSVALTVETKAATKTIVRVLVGGVLIYEDDADAALLAISKFTFSFIVPAGKKWELKVVEGTVEKVFSTYLTL